MLEVSLSSAIQFLTLKNLKCFRSLILKFGMAFGGHKCSSYDWDADFEIERSERESIQHELVS